MELIEGLIKYLDELKPIQIEHKDAEVSKEEDLEFLKEVVNQIKVKPASEKEREFLRYGFFFSGDHLFYDESFVKKMSSEKINQAILNHLFHFMSGAHFYDSYRITRGNRHMSVCALYFAHFNISKVKPSYVQNTRGSFYERHVKYDGKGLLFMPPTSSDKYFFEEYEAGNIGILDFMEFSTIEKYDFNEGIVYDYRMVLNHITVRRGINSINVIKKRIILLKNNDGTFTKVNASNAKGKELLELRKVMKTLGGEQK
ncbi:gp584 [Bacillus phage G]|uniref:Gp584 n=1 Tax=Bacillus phage G TaxID=2884420 RepID=G3MAW4_9CAUD|nr:gp584 [Bacillus phage G]AEO93829.1 gp584 [Bacillus phage G]